MWSTIHVRYNDAEYGVSLKRELDDRIPIFAFKEMVVEKLKSTRQNIFGTMLTNLDNLTLFTDEARTCEITSEEMPAGKKFYATLIDPSNSRILLEYPEAYAEYSDRGKMFMSDPAVKNFCENIVPLLYEGPFAFFEGSSGKGKTQMAFSCMELLKSKHVPTFYMPLFVSGEFDQRISRRFHRLSEKFNSLVDDDMKDNDFNPKNSSLLKLKDRALKIFGFIRDIISFDFDVENRVFSGAKISYSALVTDNLYTNLAVKPVIFLDEFYTSETGPDETKSWDRHRFIRNAFRCVGFATVLLGTNVVVANMIDSVPSSRDEGVFPWCFVIGKFPGVRLENAETIASQLIPLLQNSRPLLAQVALQYILQNPAMSDLDHMLSHVFRKVAIEKKKIFSQSSTWGTAGQCLLTRADMYVYKDKKNLKPLNMSSEIIRCHFARLDMKEDNFLFWTDGAVAHIDSTNSVSSDTRRIIEHNWKPTSMFPPVEKDILLYLSFLGGKYHNAFLSRSKKKRIPYLSAFMQAKFADSHNENPNARSNDGMALEAHAVAAVCLSSHINGVKGVRFPDFFHDLIYQLQMDDAEEFASSDEFWSRNVSAWESIKTVLDDLIIPFYAPPNQVWPDYVKNLNETNFGTIFRTRHADQIDFQSSDLVVSGECKDRSNPMNSDGALSIFRRIPEQSKLHLVFVRRVQIGDFFTKKSAEAEYNNNTERFKKLMPFKVSTKDCVLKPCYKLSEDLSQYKCVVIFVVVEDRLNTGPAQGWQADPTPQSQVGPIPKKRRF